MNILTLKRLLGQFGHLYGFSKIEFSGEIFVTFKVDSA